MHLRRSITTEARARTLPNSAMHRGPIKVGGSDQVVLATMQARQRC